MEFWTEPQMASIHKMLNPRSIAIVGATPRMQYGGRFLAAALKAKDRVRVYAVNPRLLPAVRPAPIDLSGRKPRCDTACQNPIFIIRLHVTSLECRSGIGIEA